MKVSHLAGHNIAPALLLHVRPKKRGVDRLRHPAHVRQRSDGREVANHNLSADFRTSWGLRWLGVTRAKGCEDACEQGWG